MLANVNSNSSGRDVAEAYNNQFIRYGVSVAGERSKLAFVDAHTAEDPHLGARSDV